MGIALFAFIAIFLLIGSAGLLVFYRAGMTQRLSAAIAPQRGRGELVEPAETEPGGRIDQSRGPAVRPGSAEEPARGFGRPATSHSGGFPGGRSSPDSLWRQGAGSAVALCCWLPSAA